MSITLTRKAQKHEKCPLVHCKNYGNVRTCMANELSQLSALIASCQPYIPTFAEHVLDSAAPRKGIQDILDHHFALLSTKFEDQVYEAYIFRIKQLSALANQLTPLPGLQQKVAFCMKTHNMRSTDNVITTRFHILCCLQRNVIERKTFTEVAFHEMLDSIPEKAEAQLKYIMREVRENIPR